MYNVSSLKMLCIFVLKHQNININHAGRDENNKYELRTLV